MLQIAFTYAAASFFWLTHTQIRTFVHYDVHYASLRNAPLDTHTYIYVCVCVG